MTDFGALALIRLLAFSSPAFPTGGFAYSHGLDWAVQAGDVDDEQSAAEWISDAMTDGSGRSDAILLRHAYRASCYERDHIAAFAAAACAGYERWVETLDQGRAFAASARAYGVTVDDAAYPVAFGAAAAEQQITEDAACIGYLSAWTGNLMSAAVRLVPLGQAAALRVLAGLQPVVLATAEATRDSVLEDIGSSCLRADIASLRHETQYSRMFRT